MESASEAAERVSMENASNYFHIYLIHTITLLIYLFQDRASAVTHLIPL